MFIKQISAFIENRPGRLAFMLSVLAKAGIDIRALSIADTTNYGILRLIVDNPEKAKEVLQEEGITVSITNVIGISVPDKPGGLSSVLDQLSSVGIDVSYLYAFVNHAHDEAFVIVRVDDVDKALEVLRKNNVKILTESDIV